MITEHFTHRCTIGRAPEHNNALNEEDGTPAEIASDVACLYQELRERRIESGTAELLIITRYVLYTASDVDIRAGDEVSELQTAEGELLDPGITYRVMPVLALRTPLSAHHQEVELDRIG